MIFIYPARTNNHCALSHCALRSTYTQTTGVGQMKLVELLARELKEWPEGCEYITQDCDGDVGAYRATPKLVNGDKLQHVWHHAGYVTNLSKVSCLASDASTAIVTRADREAEKARIAGEVDGGWKRHMGGKCPVEAGTLVDVRHRCGQVFEAEKAMITGSMAQDWEHDGDDGDIMAWRIHKPAEQPESTTLLAVSMVAGQQISEQPAPVSEEAIQVGIDAADAGKLTPLAEVKARWQGKKPSPKPCADPVPAVLVNPPDGPLEWRDRIYELDSMRAELEATYQRQIGEIAKERGELVGRLASEGLALVEMVARPDEDMSDPANWRNGDLITFVEEVKDRCFTTGKQYVFEELDGHGTAGVLADDEGDENGWAVEYFKWHSRPGK